MTQSAVSRQVGLLEAYLGVQLFQRERHGVRLTRAGQTYSEQILPALAKVAAATEAITLSNHTQVLRVRAYTSFIARWLIPRLPDFRRRHPGIEVKLVTGLRDVDFDRDAVDIAIQFGDGEWPGVKAVRMFADCIEPMCSPALLAQHGPKERLLEASPLLISHYRRGDWNYWLAASGHRAADSLERMSFSSSVLTWQAAVDGLGTAIGQISMLKTELEGGLLVRPFNQPVSGKRRAYWLTWPTVRREVSKLRVFIDWMEQMAQSERERL